MPEYHEKPQLLVKFGGDCLSSAPSASSSPLTKKLKECTFISLFAREKKHYSLIAIFGNMNGCVSTPFNLYDTNVENKAFKRMV